MNIFDDAFKPLREMQESILKITGPFDTAVATQQQIIQSAITSQIDYVFKHCPALSAMQNIEKGIIRVQFDNLNSTYPDLYPLTEFLTLTQNAMKAATGGEAVKSLLGAKTAMNGLSSCIREITLKDSAVYLPEQLIPDDYIFNTEPESIEDKRDDNQSEDLCIKKISPLDAFNIICTLITVLFAVIGFLQSQISPSEEQVQTIIEEQSETNELLQQQLDATQKTVDYLSTILSKIQTTVEESEENHQQNLEHSAGEYFDSQSIDSILSGSPSENPISSDEPGVPDMH